MAWMLAASAGMQALGGLLGSKSAKKAARAREQAYGDAMNYVGGAYDTATGYFDPRLEQERAAMERVNALLGLGGQAPDYSLFRDTPGYQFQLQQGQQVIERSAAARGGLASGNTLAALTQYGQGLADQTFQNYLANVMGLQSQGVDATLAGLAINRGNQLADLRLGQGGARASGIGSAAALIGALSSGANILAGFGAQRQMQNFLAPYPGTPGIVPGARASSAYGTLPIPGMRLG